MITRRDVFVALIVFLGTVCAVAFAERAKPTAQSMIFDWNNLTAKQTPVGSARSVFRGPTATLRELEMHVTTLNPGLASHPPHKHPTEEVLIIKEGTVEALVNGEWKRAGPGSIIFNGSDILHGLKNVGNGPTTYYVVSWTSSETPKE